MTASRSIGPLLGDEYEFTDDHIPLATNR